MILDLNKTCQIREITRKYLKNSNRGLRPSSMMMKAQLRGSATATATAITNSNKGPNGSLYDSFLNDLKSKALNKEPLDPRIYKKSFAEIDPKETDRYKPYAAEKSSWSSDYDPVARDRFAKDIIHLQSLLSALVSGNNFDRADSILRAIYPLSSSPEQFVFSLNKYLEAWGERPDVSLESMERYIRELEQEYKSDFKNDRTYAILISKALKSENDHYKTYLARVKRDVHLARKTFSHIDVIGVDGLSTIFQEESLSETYVPLALKQVYKQARSNKDDELGSVTDFDTDLPDYFKDNGGDVPILEKDADPLKSVDAFGLRVIRHTLLGLQSDQKNPELAHFLKNFQKEADADILLGSTADTKTDYFAISKSIADPSVREKFNEALDNFNEIRERALEAKGVDAARGRWKHEYEELQKRGGHLPLDKNLNSQMYVWYKEFLPLVKEEYEKCQKLLSGETNINEGTRTEKAQNKERALYAPYFTLVPPEKMCVIAILELLKLNSTGGIVDGMRIGRAVISVGKAVELEYRSQGLVQSEGKFFSKKKRNVREWKRLIRQRDYSANDPSTSIDWDMQIYVKLGAVLTSYLIHVAKVPVSGTDPATGNIVRALQPAFHHTYQFIMGQRLGVLKIHKSLVRQLGSKSVENSIQPQLLPMLVAPRPWTSHNNGGYLYSHNTLVRTKDSSETMAYLKASSDRLGGVYDGLNVLGETPWTINRKIFEVISHYWNTGKKFLDIPPVVDEMQYPDPPAFNAEPEEKRDYQRILKQLLTDAANMNSQRCDTNYKLEIARGFLGEKLFFPHNVDFRGRAYPLSPHLNHLGNDLTRSLFLFWDGKELGDVGLRWLKIHLSNVYGLDKVSLDERVEFAEQNLENAKACALDPYNNKWWMDGDKPWQVLGVCFELAEAYKLSDPTKYVSHMPVHQDGTCNGLQHYAALGGDLEGARQVNLVPADRPQDVYMFVAGLVQKRLDADVEAGHELAIFLQDKITRKVVKQTVMTNVYGVTFVGAVAQIRKQILHHFVREDEEKVSKTTKYLTQLVFASVRELFEGAHHIQDWLAESAKRISRAVRTDLNDGEVTNSSKPNYLSSVIWTTKLGLPCVQPYRSTQTHLIKTNLQDVSIHDPYGASQVDGRKQQTAFPPNFVHSLDATHMLMTAKACGDDGMAFASVHDSYWTHAADVDKMNAHIRNQFVDLHKDNLIVKLKEEFEERYKGFLQVVNIPGDSQIGLQIKEVRRDIVKNLGRALTLTDEAYLEHKRRQLLASSDPEEVKMGEDMVTTVSVTEGHDIHKITCSTAASRAFQVLVPLTFPEIPERGHFDISDVKKSAYFFS